MINTDRSTFYRLDMLTEQQNRISYQQSTKKKIDDGSDDSVVYTQQLFLEDKLNVYEGLKTQIQNTTAQNTVADTTLASIKTQLEDIKQEVEKGRNDTNDSISRESIATQLEGAKASLYTLLNERVQDEYVFSGSETNVQAFTQDANGKISYNGNTTLRKSAVEVDTYRERGVTGLDIMYYDTSKGTSGQALSFKEGERIIDENGREWKLNAAQTVLVEYDEDGNSTKNFMEVTTTGDSPNKVHEVSELPTNEDGSEKTFTAKHSTFDAIDDAIAALRNDDNDGLSIAIENLNDAFNAANNAHGELGARNATFEAAEERVTTKKTHYDVLAIENNDADLSKVAIEANALELVYTSLYSGISKASNLSLVNFLN